MLAEGRDKAVYCPNCGSQLNNDAVFCPNCGSSTENMQGKSAHANNTYAPPYQMPPQQHVRKTNAMAIAGFSISCVSLFLSIGGITAILALILSIMGAVQIKNTGDYGKNWATAGIILASIAIVWEIIS